MVRVLALILAFIASPLMGASAQTESGAYVCSVYNPSTGQCTAFAPIAENSMSLDAVGFTPENISYVIMFGMGLPLGLYLLGIAVGSIWRFIAAALGGPL